MRLALRGLDNGELCRARRSAAESVAAFARATERHGSLIRAWVGDEAPRSLEHYPPGGVVDTRRGAEYFYHCHRADAPEHGHLHLFGHATRSGRRRDSRRRPWRRAAPSHLIAIGLDARGLPVSLFTVNRWVTGGHWFDAATTLALVDRFLPEAGADPGDGADDASVWLRSFVRLYRPLIARVLRARDRRLARAGGGHAEAALDDRAIEVASSVRLDWAGDLQQLEAELAARGLAAPA